MVTKQTTILYTSLAPVKCTICIRLCIQQKCKVEWDLGESECIHVSTINTCAGDEIGWLFVNRVLSCGQTFSAFSQEMTHIYKMRSPESRGFMSTPVFLQWWYSWASNQKKDFRKPCPVCKFNPKRLACDGTHVGISLKNVTCPPLKNLKEDDPTLPTPHKRNDRCFLAYNDLLPKSAQVIRDCREHLSYFCQKAEGKVFGESVAAAETEKEWSKKLKEHAPAPTRSILGRFLSDTMPSREKKAFGSLAKMLATTMPLMALIPPRFAEETLTLVQHINTTNEGDQIWVEDSLDRMKTYAPEVHQYLCMARIENGTIPPDSMEFISYLCKSVLSFDYTEPEMPIPVPGTYNPPKYGRAYYFSPTGSQVRKCRKFSMDKNRAEEHDNYDDEPASGEKCSKIYPKVSGKGATFTFFWFCPTHHHCYGFHIISGGEGRKDPADSLYMHLEVAPEEIFYDFACGFHEYVLNRESGFFKNTRVFHDIFHGYTHKCAKTYKSSRLISLESVNSEICEQFNSFIQCIKRSATQMSQEHFVFYLQFFIDEWNRRKENRYKRRLTVALLGSQ